MMTHENDSYVLKSEFGDILWQGPQVAVAFSFNKENAIHGTLHKYGSPEVVCNWAEVARKKYVEAGLSGLADEIITVVGLIPVEAINKMIDITGYVGVWYQKIMRETNDFRADGIQNPKIK